MRLTEDPAGLPYKLASSGIGQIQNFNKRKKSLESKDFHL
jgi:hypothetical protein